MRTNIDTIILHRVIKAIHKARVKVGCLTDDFAAETLPEPHEKCALASVQLRTISEEVAELTEELKELQQVISAYYEGQCR